MLRRPPGTLEHDLEHKTSSIISLLQLGPQRRCLHLPNPSTAAEARLDIPSSHPVLNPFDSIGQNDVQEHIEHRQNPSEG